MMKNVALVALLSAPAALAFTPANLAGVWSCKTLDKWVYKDGFASKKDVPTLKVKEPTAYDDDHESVRVIVFDEASNAAVRRFSGRSYWLNLGTTDCIEPHDFHGNMISAIDGEFYLDANSANQECDGSKDISGTAIDLSKTGTTPLGGLKVPTATQLTAKQFVNDEKTCGYASCSDIPEGPWEFTFDDADHFTLTIDPNDKQRHHDLTAGATNFAERVFGLEKCMRGLAAKSEMCDKLVASKINTDDEQNAACQGALQCLVCDDSTNPKTKCCTTEKPKEVVYTPQPYYYPPQYYPQQQWSYNPYQSPYYSQFGR